MTGETTTQRWRQCAGCGRERRLARTGMVLCDHNRWDPASSAMVACEGSGREPVPALPVVSAAQAGQGHVPALQRWLAEPAGRGA